MRCLEKDRTRRYETANSLADDVVRHLNNEPVVARPPSRGYRLQKLVQRNRGTFAAGAVVTVALVAGLGFSLWTLAKERVAWRQALSAERRAQAEAGKSQQVAQLLKDMLQGVGPSVALGRDTTMLREILDKTAQRVGKDLKGQQEVEAELRMTLGEVYQALGQYDQAEGMYRAALGLRRTLWGDMNTNVADSLDLLGHELHSCRGEAVESASLIQQALVIRTNLLGLEHVQVAASLEHLGGVQAYKGELVEAADLFRRALAMRRRLLGDYHAEVVESLTLLADTVRYLGEPVEAEGYAREALAILSRLTANEPASLKVASVQEALAGALRFQGKLEEAMHLLQEVVTTRQNLLGSDHPEYASALYNLGYTLMEANQLDLAEPVIRNALTVSRKAVGDQPGHTAYSLEALGIILRRTGRLAEAEAAYREALVVRRIPNNQYMFAEPTLLVAVLHAQGKFAEAKAVMAEAVAEARATAEKVRALPPSEAGLGAQLRLVQALWRQGEVVEAELLLPEILETAKQLPPSAILADRISFQAMRIAALQVWFGRQTEHAALCRQMVQWAARQPEFAPKGRAAGMTSLRPLADPQLQASALTLAPAGSGSRTHQFLPALVPNDPGRGGVSQRSPPGG